MEDILHFTAHLDDDCKIENILYELITNAMDADPSNLPNVSAPESNLIVISDAGRGLDRKHIEIIGRLSERSPALHGSHGIGLKDVISACVSQDRGLTIESKGKEYSFEKQVVGEHDCFIRLVEKPSSYESGTKITLRDKNAMKEVSKIRNKFLSLHPSILQKLPCSTPEIEVYDCTNDLPKGGIFIKGVLKTGHCNLTRIYNFVNPTPEQKNSISREHTFVAGKFKKYFKEPIERVNNDETFGIDPPRQVSPSIAYVPVSPQCSVDSAIVQAVNEHCMKQDYFLWTLGTQERKRIGSVRDNMLDLLRRFNGISVSQTNDQGSWTKNTFLPLVSDIDIIVRINDYSPSSAQSISERLTKALRKNHARIEDSGNRIINCTYQGVEFDLVLDGTASSDRYLKIKNAPDPIRLRMQSFIRAMKYWASRNGLHIKSCAIEEAVLALWDSIDADHSNAFRYFLQNVGDELEKPDIKDFYELCCDSITDVKDAAKATISMLSTRTQRPFESSRYVVIAPDI